MSQEDPEPPTAAGGSDALSLAREETRTTFEYQVQRLEEIDNKAIEILKANLLLIGIVVTAGSILVQTDFRTDPFVNVFTGFGAVLLFVSTALAGVTYNASNLRGGLDADDVEAAIARRAADADEAFERRLLRSYGRWIEYNAQVTAVNDLLVTATVLLVVTSFAYVVAGVAVGAAGLSTAASLVAFGAFTVPAAWLVRTAYHMDHLGSLREEDEETETFAGVRLSKGASREEGRVVLLGMLRGRETGDGGERGEP